jgi:hypothetical protein
MMLQAKAALGDDDDSLSHTGLCSDFYVFKWVLTAASLALCESASERFFPVFFTVLPGEF